jgi:hypothetical protein
MTSPAGAAAQARSSAVAELFDALEGLLIVYQSLPTEDRDRRWSGDAERITGEVARHLCAARTRISSTFGPPL